MQHSTEIHTVTAGDTEPEGNCPGSPRHYRITCRDGSAMPNCGVPGSGPTSPPAQSQTWLPLNAGPTPRYGSAMAEIPVGPTQSLVLFGGRGLGVPGTNPATDGFSPTTGPLADTWVWAGGSWVLAAPAQLSGCDLGPQTQAPCPSSGHSMAYDGHGHVIMVGGDYIYQDSFRNISRPVRETWSWDGTSWTYLGNGPESGHGSIAYNPTIDQVVLFGGGVSDFSTSDSTYIWNRSALRWDPASPGRRPQARRLASMAFDPTLGKVILFGASTRSLNGPTLISATRGRGMEVPGRSSIRRPARRRGAARRWGANATCGGQPAPRTCTPQVVLFGGHDATPPVDGLTVPTPGLADTWVWNGSTWQRQEPANAPVGRGQSALAYYSPTDQYILFGGDALDGSDDTWGYTRTSPPATTVPAG